MAVRWTRNYWTLPLNSIHSTHGNQTNFSRTFQPAEYLVPNRRILTARWIIQKLRARIQRLHFPTACARVWLGARLITEWKSSRTCLRASGKNFIQHTVVKHGHIIVRGIEGPVEDAELLKKSRVRGSPRAVEAPLGSIYEDVVEIRICSRLICVLNVNAFLN